MVAALSFLVSCRKSDRSCRFLRGICQRRFLYRHSCALGTPAAASVKLRLRYGKSFCHYTLDIAQEALATKAAERGDVRPVTVEPALARRAIVIISA